MNIVVVPVPQAPVVPSSKPVVKFFVGGVALGIVGTLVALDQLEKRKIEKALNKNA